ncbi:MAG: GGDEF domain-containing protein [Spirochaetales bacterium]
MTDSGRLTLTQRVQTALGLIRLSHDDWGLVRTTRRRRNAANLRYVAGIVAFVFLVQSVVSLVDPDSLSEPWVDFGYKLCFWSGFAVAAFFFVFWTLKPSAHGQSAFLHATLFLGMTLCLLDLQSTADLSTFTLILFGTAVLYSGPVYWYPIAFALSWALLSLGMIVTHPQNLGPTPLVSSFVIGVVASASGIILELRRIRTELLSLELGRRNLELKEASLRDALTGLHNRRFLLEWMQKQGSLNRRGNHALSVALLDLDHFKSVNDSAGHNVGDEVLKQAARWLERSLRASDLIARYGGEEFVVVLQETQLEKALPVMQRCLDDFRKSLVPGWDKTVTFSAGLTAVRGDETAEALLKRADDLLYAAKEAGRNRIITD